MEKVVVCHAREIMLTKEFKDIISEVLKPLGFKKKRNYWRLETDEIEKIINLQRSNFSNLYYVNFGYNIKKLNYDGVIMHIYNRLPQVDAFDLENPLDLNDRINKIRELINGNLIPSLDRINTESDILEVLKYRSHLNDIPLKVKKYLKLKD
ncbi:MAG TPA: DUF4304 domain-containing protein [Cytophagaceae bacterium]